MDYLWLVQTGDYDEDAAVIARELRNIPDVQLTRIFDKSELKSLNNLLV